MDEGKEAEASSSFRLERSLARRIEKIHIIYRSNCNKP